jgi:excisionase family DNA binding protein
MTNNTITTPITSWTELWAADREILSRAEVALLLGVDPRTVDAAVDDGTIRGVRLGRRVLIPRQSLLDTLGIREPSV